MMNPVPDTLTDTFRAANRAFQAFFAQSSDKNGDLPDAESVRRLQDQLTAVEQTLAGQKMQVACDHASAAEVTAYAANLERLKILLENYQKRASAGYARLHREHATLANLTAWSNSCRSLEE